MASSQLATTVNANIVTVRDEKQKAVDGLRSQWFGGEQAESSAKAINSLTTRIEVWAAKGIAGAATNKAPAATGWPGWVKAGRELVNGIHEIYDLGDRAALKDIAIVVKEAPATSAKAVAKVTKEVAGAVGDTAGALVKPLMLPLVIIVGAAIALVLVLKHAKVL